MKKRLLSVLLIALTLFVITGCSSNRATPNSEGNNTATGTNTSKSSKHTTIDLNKNVVTSEAVAKNGKLIVLVTNNNTVAVDMEMEVEFYDAEGTIIGSDDEGFTAVSANATVAAEIYSTPDKWDNYKVYVDVEETNEISYFDKISINHSNSDRKIAVQVTNNSDETIEQITVAVVYYQDDKIVGLENGYEFDIKSGRSANFNIYYASDKNYRDVKFDTYKVIVTEAYSYNW